MRVIGHVLRKIENDKQLMQQIVQSPAVAELVSNYNALAVVAQAAEDDHLKMVTGETYGQEFKHYLTHLPSIDLHRLLDRYLSHFAQSDKGNATRERSQVEAEEGEGCGDGLDHYETETEKEKRRHRYFLIKCLAIAALFTFFVVLGAMVAILTHTHTADNAVFKAIMGTATEVLKVLFTMK
jgi:uncharacterized membrane protein